MGFSRKRTGRDGKPRYTAYYLDIRGQERSAGTFSSKKDARRRLEEGRGGGQRRASRVTPAAAGRPSRRTSWRSGCLITSWNPASAANYAGQIRKHLLPFFGPMKMRDIMPEHVRQWVTTMKDKGASARTIEYCKGSILNAIFTTALDDEVVTIHPSHGVKTPPAPGQATAHHHRRPVRPLYQALPDADARLLVETDIESGMRWGELTELRVRDLDFETRILTVSRAVVELTQEDHPDGRPVPGQGLPEGQGVPAVQAQPADHRQDPGPRHRQGSGRRRPALHLPAARPARDQAP